MKRVVIALFLGAIVAISGCISATDNQQTTPIRNSTKDTSSTLSLTTNSQELSWPVIYRWTEARFTYIYKGNDHPPITAEKTYTVSNNTLYEINTYVPDMKVPTKTKVETHTINNGLPVIYIEKASKISNTLYYVQMNLPTNPSADNSITTIINLHITYSGNAICGAITKSEQTTIFTISGLSQVRTNDN